MRTKRKTRKNAKTRKLPIYKIRMMTDDERNRLAYQNYLEREAAKRNE